MKRNYPTILDSIQLIFFMLIVFLFSYILVIIFENILNISLSSNPYISILITFLSEILTIFYAYKETNISYDKLLFLKRIPLILFMPIMILEIGTDILSSEFSNIIQIFFNISSSNSIKNPVNILYSIFLTPLLEEILFRGFILKGFLKNYNKFTAIIMSSLFFALLHIKLNAVILAFISGILFAYLYIKTKSLISCIFAHFLSNAVHNMLSYAFNIYIQGYNLNASSIQHQPLWFNILGIIFVLIGFFTFSKSCKQISS